MPIALTYGEPEEVLLKIRLESGVRFVRICIRRYTDTVDGTTGYTPVGDPYIRIFDCIPQVDRLISVDIQVPQAIAEWMTDPTGPAVTYVRMPIDPVVLITGDSFTLHLGENIFNLEN